MFCRTNQWEAAKFPKELFHDSNSSGGRVLMHTKVRSSCSPILTLSQHPIDDYRNPPSNFFSVREHVKV